MGITNTGPRIRVDEIADAIYRISTPVPPSVIPGGFTFNQFFVVDQQPLLLHTGPRRMFPLVREAMASVMPPARLRWVAFSHREPDEWGALNEWLEAAPQATAGQGNVGVMEKLAGCEPTRLACIHGSSWRGGGGKLLREVEKALDV